MSKIYLEKKGYGRSTYFVIKSASKKKEKELEASGEKTFDSREEAMEEIRSRKWVLKKDKK